MKKYFTVGLCFGRAPGREAAAGGVHTDTRQVSVREKERDRERHREGGTHTQRERERKRERERRTAYLSDLLSSLWKNFMTVQSPLCRVTCTF